MTVGDSVISLWALLFFLAKLSHWCHVTVRDSTSPHTAILPFGCPRCPTTRHVTVGDSVISIWALLLFLAKLSHWCHVTACGRAASYSTFFSVDGQGVSKTINTTEKSWCPRTSRATPMSHNPLTYFEWVLFCGI